MRSSLAPPTAVVLINGFFSPTFHFEFVMVARDERRRRRETRPQLAVSLLSWSEMDEPSRGHTMSRSGFSLLIMQFAELLAAHKPQLRLWASQRFRFGPHQWQCVCVWMMERSLEFCSGDWFGVERLALIGASETASPAATQLPAAAADGLVGATRRTMSPSRTTHTLHDFSSLFERSKVKARRVDGRRTRATKRGD